MQDFGIDLSAEGLIEMSFEKGDSLKNNILLSIYIHRGTCFWNTSFGSRLYMIKKISANSIALAKDYCLEAIKWLIDTGRTVKHEVVVERDSDIGNRLNIAIMITKADGRTVTYNTFFSVV